MKRILAFVMALCLLFTTGCAGKAPEPTAAPDAAAQPQAAEGRTMDAQYEEEYYPFPGGYFNGDIARIENKLLILGQNGADGFLLGLAGYSQEENGRVSIEPAQIIDMSGQGYVNCLTAGADGYFYVQTAPESGYSAEYTILRYDTQGQLVDSMVIRDWPMDKYLLDICVTADSKLILIGDNAVALCPWQGESLEFAGIGEGLLSCTLTDKGLVVSTFRMAGILDVESLSFQAFPEEKLGDVFSFVETQGLAGEYVINNGSQFVLCDPETCDVQELLTWNFQLTSGRLGSCARLTEDSFICSFADQESLLVCGMEQVPYVERQPLNIALVGLWDNALGDTRELSKTYDIKTVTYGMDEIDRFLTELGAGNTPDLVLFGDGLNTASDRFEDLYPYLDADPELSRDSFLPNLLPALETNGQLHMLWSQTEIISLKARTADVGDGYGLKPADYTRMVAESGKYKTVFEGFMSDTNLLGWISSMSMGTFIDWGAGTCSFDSPEFRELLAWCADMNKDMFEGEIYTGPQYEQSEVLMFLGLVQSPQAVAGMFEMQGEPMTWVGFPNGAGGYSYYDKVMNAAMAIPRDSQNKEGAWAFIRSRLTLESQLNLGDFGGLPVNVQALERLLEAQTDQETRDKFFALLDQVKYAQTSQDEKLREIIIENGKAFLQGDKPLEDTVKLIQSKAGIYLAERS